MAATLGGGGSGLASIPEDQPLPSVFSEPAAEGSSKPESKWDTLKRVVKSQTLQLVGLEHSQLSQEHQEHLQRSIVVGKVKRRADKSDQYTCERSLLEAIAPHESVSPVTTRSLIRQLSVRSNYQLPPTPTQQGEASDAIELRTIQPSLPRGHSEPGLVSMGTTQPSKWQRAPLEHSLSLPVETPSTSLHQSARSQDQSTLNRTYLSKPTGRLEAEPEELQTIEPKPDLWKIALLSLRFISQAAPKEETITRRTLRDNISFDPITEEEEETDGVTQPVPASPPVVVDQVEDEDVLPVYEDADFFGLETTDGRIAKRFLYSKQHYGEKEPPPPDYDSLGYTKDTKKKKPTAQRRKKRTGGIHLFGRQYRGPVGGTTLGLLSFNYKHVPESTRHRLNELERSSFHRPFFTYWLITVHILILIFSLSAYEIAPYGYVLYTRRALVQQSNLAVGVEEKNITPNVWLGPRQESLVLLGATYGPCMRRDRQLFTALDRDREREANNSGCCVRRDGSGCVQVSSREQCPELFSDFVYTDPNPKLNDSQIYSDRAVCGTSPLSCLDPDPGRDIRWRAEYITDWPICQDFQTLPNSEHLSCNITGRPCCVGIQAHCLITTQEHCDFLEGRFHRDAFLCSQVDCLKDICGLLPFVSMNVPDQFYRVWTALFLHAGIIHLVFTLMFHLFILRHVEKYLGWLRTSLIYIGSGIGGNIVSAVFVPYNPEVGPAGGIFGIIAFFLIYIMYQAHRLVRPWLEALKLFVIILILLVCGLFPYIDNFAHFGGFLFGTLLSGVVVPYYPPLEAELAYYRDKHKRDYNAKYDWIQISKYLFIFAGLPTIIALYVLFFVLFYVYQDAWDGFRYLNCIPFTSTFCLNFGQNIRSRDIFL